MIVGVRFNNVGKVYFYNTNIKMLGGGVYDITTNNGTTYSSYVTVSHTMPGIDKTLRTITDAKMIKGPRRPEKPYKDIFVNEAKRTICVVWKDGTKTVMKPHPDDEWDVEKGVALCFMKRMFDNRGCYYNTFRDVTYMGD